MKKRWTIAVLALSLCLLAGCRETLRQREEPADPICADSSAYLMAETPDGFYYSSGNILYYADKADLLQWAPVCSRPSCSHTGPECKAYLGGDGRFVLRDDRIYFCDDHTRYDPDGASGTVLAGMALDGEDRKIVYTVSGSLTQTGGSDRFCLLGDQLIAMYSRMNDQGTFDTYMVRVDDQGEQTLFTGTMEQLPSWLGAVTRYEGMGGDTALYFCLDDGRENWAYTLYRPTAEKLVELGEVSQLGSLMNLDFVGSYLHGEILRVYRPGDGYYDVDLSTGGQTKVMDAQLDGAWGWQLTQQYAVESTLLYRPLAYQTEPEDREQAMMLYDGEAWRTVSLPEELAQGALIPNLRPLAVASDRIFFQAMVEDQRRLYQVELEREDLDLVSVMAVSAP